MNHVRVVVVKNINSVVEKNKQYYIGLMSGTSLDGVDCVIYDFTTSTLIASSFTPYSKELRHNIQALCGNTTLKDIATIDIALAELYADCVNTILHTNNTDASQIIAIGNHGQTIYHAPQQYSWQLGNNTLLATLTGITVIGDFRTADIFAGGQGAPLTPKYHEYLLTRLNLVKGIVVNLGGIANITSIDEGGIIGFDSGPANTLIDNYMLKTKGLEFDRDGLFARSGFILEDILEQMLADEYFSQALPKSTGVEYFNLAWLDNFLGGYERPQDVVRTLTELTALSITNAINTTHTIYVCGGGALNTFLMERIEVLSGCEVLTTNELGMHPNFIEAVAFAYFAKLHIENKTANVPSVTGANKETILGTKFRSLASKK
jgi:anhydro-N-acetylmuramic acid kinase